jgi:hypothetical protein
MIFITYLILNHFFKADNFGELSIKLDANYKAMLYTYLKHSNYFDANTAHVPVHTKSAVVHIPLA